MYITLVLFHITTEMNVFQYMTTERMDFHYMKLEMCLYVLICGDVLKEKICCMQPVNVSSDVSFIMNIEALDNPNDLKADVVGVWERKGSPVAYFSVHKRNGKIKIYRRSKLGSISNHFKITRTYYKHTDSPDFSRPSKFSIINVND